LCDDDGDVAFLLIVVVVVVVVGGGGGGVDVNNSCLVVLTVCVDNSDASPNSLLVLLSHLRPVFDDAVCFLLIFVTTAVVALQLEMVCSGIWWLQWQRKMVIC